MKGMIMILLAFLFLPAVAESHPLQLDLERDAREAIARMDFETALNLYRQLSERNPENTDYIIWIGRISGWLADYSSADAALDRALQSEPRNADALIAKAYIRMYQRRYVDAAGLLDQARKIVPSSPDLELAAARNYHFQGQDGAAADHLERALAIDPGNAEVRELRDQISPKRFEVTFGYGFDRFSFAPDAHAATVSFGYIGRATRLAMAFERWEKFGSIARRAGALASQRFGNRLWLRAGAAFAPDAVVLARSEYTTGFSVTLPKGIVLGSDYRTLKFLDARVHVASPSLEYYLEWPIWFQMAFYKNWTDYETPLSSDAQSESYLIRYNHQWADPVILRLSYARGTENFSALSVDRIGRFIANTFGAGTEIKLSPDVSTTLSYSFQRRSTGSTQKSFGIGFTVRR